MEWSYCYKEVLPLVAMVTVQCTTVGLNTLYKAATSEGLSYYVFIVYSFVIANFLLLPLAFFFGRRVKLPTEKLPLFFRIFLLGLIGFLAQVTGYKGIEDSSPTLASAMSNLTPGFTFILAVIFRLEKLSWRSSSSLAKVIGTIVSIAGALLIVLYKGPTIFSNSSPTPNIQVGQPQASSNSKWLIGGLLLATEYMLYSTFYILQAQVLKTYPAATIVTFYYSLCVTIVSVPVGFIVERDLSAWMLEPDIKLAAILYSGFFGAFFSSLVHIWSVGLKGPLFVAIFQPLSIAIAAASSVIFLGEDIYLGSVIGAIIICAGFYAVIWGKARDHEDRLGEDFPPGDLRRSPDDKVPLLLNDETES